MNTGKRANLTLIVISLVSLAAFLVFWVVRKQSVEPDRDVRPIAVSTVRPQRMSLNESLVLTAILETRQTVAVVPRVPGLIMEIRADQGDRVSEGQILARIDSQAYRLELQAAESAWLLAEGSLKRITTVMESSGASRQQLDQARTSRDAALANYELAKMQFDYAEVRSPLSGRVLARFFDVGNLAPTDKPLFIVGDDSGLQVKVRVPEKYWDHFNGPDPLRVVTSYPSGVTGEKEVVGVRLVSPTISPQDRCFEVTCDIPQEQVSWPVGARIEVEFVLSEMTETWSLPLRALSGDTVWKVDEGRVTALSSPAIFRDGRRFAVPDEWADSVFVLDGQTRLEDGLPVTPYDGGTQL